MKRLVNCEVYIRKTTPTHMQKWSLTRQLILRKKLYSKMTLTLEELCWIMTAIYFVRTNQDRSHPPVNRAPMLMKKDRRIMTSFTIYRVLTLEEIPTFWQLSARWREILILGKLFQRWKIKKMLRTLLNLQLKMIS
jgi:hypothetical protein